MKLIFTAVAVTLFAAGTVFRETLSADSAALETDNQPCGGFDCEIQLKRQNSTACPASAKDCGGCLNGYHEPAPPSTDSSPSLSSSSAAAKPPASANQQLETDVAGDDEEQNEQKTKEDGGAQPAAARASSQEASSASENEIAGNADAASAACVAKLFEARFQPGAENDGGDEEGDGHANVKTAGGSAATDAIAVVLTLGFLACLVAVVVIGRRKFPRRHPALGEQRYSPATAGGSTFPSRSDGGLGAGPGRDSRDGIRGGGGDAEIGDIDIDGGAESTEEEEIFDAQEFTRGVAGAKPVTAAATTTTAPRAEVVEEAFHRRVWPTSGRGLGDDGVEMRAAPMSTGTAGL